MPESDFISQLFDLGGTVTTTGMFIWYLIHRNGKHDKAMTKLFDGLGALHKAQETHTRVLINVAKTHKLDGDADNLLDS